MRKNKEIERFGVFVKRSTALARADIRVMPACEWRFPVLPVRTQTLRSVPVLGTQILSAGGPESQHTPGASVKENRVPARHRVRR
ncbi:MAG: hypothetical protein EOR30_13945 [Mesorhizobium sp.]|nr:hypothetical protein EOA78_26135 [Mesorhizobium sp. M5C.F.Cr.IN.023.01.1.1]RWF81097.1 MAG: hypothetical protein EOQ36_31610 [Mesorhizobium sp.]RWF93188.1 MAG: hypothetical protein EOQ45_17590 [Mesorhizobium sp.]RWI37248.1 MAG: hypothetical protein EOR14_25420 [Mesorhizobium sp.]RWI45122.1 MAG: hypothetical protein EOR15_24110 [Mesorhizobium sp.]